MVNCYNCFNTWCLAGLFLPQYCTVLVLVCRKTCTIAAYWYTCTYNMLYSLSYVREQCDDELWVSLKSFPLTSPFPSQKQDSYSRSWPQNVVAMMMEAARTAAMLVLLLQSISHPPPENCSLHSHCSDCSRLSKAMLLSYVIFCIDLLLFYTPNIMNFTSLLGAFIYWIVCL